MSEEMKRLSELMRLGFLASVSSGAIVLISYAAAECAGRSDIFWTLAFDYELHFVCFAVALVYFIARSRGTVPQEYTNDRR